MPAKIPTGVFGNNGFLYIDTLGVFISLLGDKKIGKMNLMFD